ncbi:MAG: hypothetical protein A3F11_02065 [Gammaproteobacteria bacterium RIFCSPHIGHO2_12_FULL_37_14]|nr:MAG: hypothetical protein A3F11_02065 [Gammaproteobacteria bacterium RIFCSPHIGHO2_12_FULL_37_14]
MNEALATELPSLINFNESVIQVVNRLLQDAILNHASDIHIEPYHQHCRIRFRSDSLLHEVATFPSPLAMQMITRLKIMANLNIAERRLPQDGHISLQNDHKIDIRISTCPTLFGEKIVLRLLNSSAIKSDIHQLGLTDTQQQLFLNKLKQPQGLILVTGPTGSGKTITLYSALHYLNQIEKNIVTIEDPVEIELAGINQVMVNNKIGLDFATILRTFLRQDPDIIMVGEIRDNETATIALQAAQTGHLVLSTLHTNNAIETITRLQHMGIPSYHLIASISLIIAQRLVRRLCQFCKHTHLGCENCHEGFKGRIGIFEVLPITHSIAKIILAGGDRLKILNQAKAENIMFLAQAAQKKVEAGITNIAEVDRVLTNELV